jgi:hypothetical protein
VRFRFAIAAVCAGSALAGTGHAGAQPRRAGADGGSGTYAATGTTYYFALTNTGTAAWQFFYVVGPPGMTFVGGTTSNEASARCVAGQPDGQPNEIECGPLSASVAPSHGQVTFGATLAAPVACGSTFQLYVGSLDMPLTRTADITESGSCTATVPAARTPPMLRGTPVVGHTLTATAPVWSAPPTRVAYRWQRCTHNTCTTVANASRQALKLTPRDAGHSVRLVATALIDGTTVESVSKKLAVRAR